MLTEGHPAHLVQRCAVRKMVGRITDVVKGGLDLSTRSASLSVWAREVHCAGSVRGARRLGGMARGKAQRPFGFHARSLIVIVRSSLSFMPCVATRTGRVTCERPSYSE